MAEWPCWRLYLPTEMGGGGKSLEEIERMTMCRVMDANDALDAMAEAQARYAKRKPAGG
jgi:hypothetical protein